MKYTYEQTCFSSLSDEDSCYFLGLLYADGNIYKHFNNWLIQIGLKDRDCIEQFKTYLKTNREIYYRKDRNSHCMFITNKIIGDNLIKLGMFPQKSRTLKFPIDLIPSNNVRHFIRGYFDGDGCISLIKSQSTYRLRFCLVGTYDMMFNMQNILIDTLNISKTKIKQHSQSEHAFELHIKKIEDVNKIRNYLYDNSTKYMQRKKDVFYSDLIKYKFGKSTSKYKNVCFKSNSWNITYYDSTGKRKGKSGFKTEDEAYTELIRLQSIIFLKKN